MTAQLALPNTLRKCPLIGSARLRRLAGMRVDPNPPELFGLPARIHLPIEKVGHGIVVEADVRPGAGLGYELHIFYEQQVVAAKSQNHRSLYRRVTQEQELGPGRRAEPQPVDAATSSSFPSSS